MRVAFVGKGGAGKSAIAGTLARVLARRGHSVLAIDSDPMPGLAFSLGVETTDAPIPDEAVQERAQDAPGPRFRLRDGLGATEAIARYGIPGPDGVQFLQFGKLRGAASALARSQFAFREIVAGLPDDGWTLVGDLPGGTRQPFFGWGEYARTILVVVEPTAKSLLSARRLARLGQGQRADFILGVANKVRGPDDVELIGRRSALKVIAAVPWDESLADAERQGRAPLDAVPDSAAVLAVTSLADRLVQGAG
ncbi:MAG: AAA family ATPase [Actinomycetota bacterium]|nr:AAA family ATPase [Actinomycetota bacterium]